MKSACFYTVLLSMVICAFGCRTANVRVVDVETGEPIYGVQVVPHYWSELFGWPIGAAGNPVVTGIDGRAKLRTGRWNSFTGFEIFRDGYVHWRDPNNVIPTVDPGEVVKTNERTETILKMYQAPSPVALLTVPRGYKGPVLITRPAFPNMSLPTGQRVHEFVVHDPSVPTVIPRVPPLHMLWTSQIQARYAEGRHLPAGPDFLRPQRDGVEIFELETYRDIEVLFVGTAKEFRDFCRRVNHPSGRFWDFSEETLNQELSIAVQSWKEHGDRNPGAGGGS